VHYYQHHIGDFIKDTSNLDDHQLATYLRMLWSYYTDEKPLSGEFDDIAFAMRSDEKTVRLLLRHFFTESEGGWVHARCEREIAEYRTKGEKARNSANARWKNTNAMRTHSERNANDTVLDANQEPITNNQFKEVPTVLGDKPAANRPPASPNEAIVELYHKHLPMCPRVEVLNDGRKRAIAARWREIVTDKEIAKTPDAKQAALDFFDWYFERAATSAFLTGKAKNWRADFDFLINPSKFTKVVEGHYHKEKA
jgi:uncharacterized protein YdaU (DUF1376 family)